jgi:YegS/Rv2252/BmrU family lipid kinase
MHKYNRAVLFYNTSSGKSKKGHHLEIIKEHYDNNGIPLKTILFPVPEENIRKTIEDASCSEDDLIIAAGGDGTISLICNKIIGTEIPLGILPLGTGNLLAQQLKIPMNFIKALSLLTDQQSKKIRMDTFHYENQCGILNVSVGLTPKVMQKTPSQEKQRYGIFAYIIHFIQQFLGLKRHRFFIEYDGANISYVASEVLVTNVQLTGIESLTWSDDISINDGRLDLFIIRSTNISDILGLLISLFRKKKRHNNIMKHVHFSDYCRIETQTPIDAQADGDAFGETPLEIKVNPRSLTVIVGKNYKNQFINEWS